MLAVSRLGMLPQPHRNKVNGLRPGQGSGASVSGRFQSRPSPSPRKRLKSNLKKAAILHGTAMKRLWTVFLPILLPDCPPC
jgi:hypothetical protein